MGAVFGLDLLFSRKGEAVPAVQTGVPLTRPNRFEALARTLGQQDVALARRDGVDDAESGRRAGARPAQPQPQPQPQPEARTHRPAVTPFPHLRAVPADGSGLPGAGSEADDGGAQGDTRPVLDGGMIVRRSPADEPAVRPWQKVRAKTEPEPEPAPGPETLAQRPQERRPPPWVALSGGGRAGASDRRAETDSLEDTGELEVFLFGADGQGAEGPGEADADAGATEVGRRPRRRHVSVRLPAREHALLRQFAKVWGTTQQNIVRRAILLHMIEELKQRLDATPRETAVDGAIEGCE